MAPYEHFGLGIETQVIHKKYLGETDDLHFIPSSPLISRQYLTPQEEGELKRVCALVLANVQHSDDPPDDPLATLPDNLRLYSQAQVQNKVEIAVVPKIIDSSTDSRSSSRGNLHSDNGKSNRTMDSTPLTSVGITPDTAKFKHDYFSLPNFGKPTSASKLKLDRTGASPPPTVAQQLTMRMIADTFGEPQTDRPRLAKHNTRVTTEKVPTTQSSTERKSKSGTRQDARTTTRPTTSGAARPTSSGHSDSESKLNKLVRSMSRKRSSTNVSEAAIRSASTVSEPVPVLPSIAALMDMTRSQPHSPVVAQGKTAPTSPALPSPTSRSRFRLRLFGRKNKPNPVLVA